MLNSSKGLANTYTCFHMPMTQHFMLLSELVNNLRGCNQPSQASLDQEWDFGEYWECTSIMEIMLPHMSLIQQNKVY